MKRLLIQLYYTLIYYVPNLARELFFLLTIRDYLTLNGYIDFRWGRYRAGNLGDDLNKILFADAQGRRMVLAEWSWLARLSGRTSYSLIGSVAQAAGPSTIVWGSGILGEQYAQQLQRPKRICSVRGPLTRHIYLDQGIECPAIYGDPALLLPRFYQPQTKKKRYRIGIIAHIYDETNPALMHLRNSEDIAFISMRDSDHWQQVVDQINACELIASSSLHGIIIADAYGVPNGWVELSNRVLGKGFKFIDYFLSVGRPCTEPLQLTAQTTLDELLALRAQWQAPQIDLQPMIEACPLNLLFSQQ